jgi:hypothetical protein
VPWLQQVRAFVMPSVCVDAMLLGRRLRFKAASLDKAQARANAYFHAVDHGDCGTIHNLQTPSMIWPDPAPDESTSRTVSCISCSRGIAL